LHQENRIMKKITAVFGAFIALVQAFFMLVLVAIAAPLHYFARRFWCLNEGPADMKEVMTAIEKKFAEVKENAQKIGEQALKALEQSRAEGTLHKEMNDKITEIGTKGKQLSDELVELKQRALDIEQRLAKAPGSGSDEPNKTAGQLFAESPEVVAMLKSKDFKSAPVSISRKTIVNSSGSAQPLVDGARVPGIIAPAGRRLMIRDLLPQIPTNSNLVEFCQELVFTDSSAPQYDNTSPTAYSEGAVKAQSNITFQLGTAAVVTVSAWLGASRQVLSDAAQLAGYIDSRLAYGIKLEEEDELLTGDGTVGTLTGLNSSATAFTGGVTNQTALDTLLKAIEQVALSYYETDAFILHPTDWTAIQVLKDTTGRYLFTNPQDITQPRIWGKPCVVTAAQTSGTWTAGAFSLAAAIYDREDLSIRVSDQHSDFFTRNLVAILAEERLALAIYRSAAIVKGSISYAG
jgi:HK97 family phage major capsid protein